MTTSPQWVDTHCHLFMCDEPRRLMERARSAGVGWVMVPGVDLETSLQARNLAVASDGTMLWSVGLHPHEASRWPDEEGRISALAAEADALGECGLDYYRDLSPRADQQAALAAQLELAVETSKPIILHCRDAFADMYEMLAEADLGESAVLHCWTGGPKWTKRFAELGVTFSFAGPVTYETGDTVRRGAAAAPPERTMVETDTPYLTPPPNRHARNEPANVVAVGRALAAVWGVDLDEVARMTTATATRVFRR